MTKLKSNFAPISAWADRFNKPSCDRLVAGMPPGAVGLFKQARRMLHELGLGFEVAVWRGESWKWTIDFRNSLHPNPSHPNTLAILVPSPENPQMAIPVSREFIDSLPFKRLKKAVREGLELASEPFDTNLAIWYLTGAPIIADLHDLLQRRVRHLARKTG